jgi:hypothetical protein
MLPELNDNDSKGIKIKSKRVEQFEEIGKYKKEVTGIEIFYNDAKNMGGHTLMGPYRGGRVNSCIQMLAF